MALGLLALIILVALVIFLVKTRKRKDESVVVPVVPPHAAALEALRALREKNYPSTGRIKEYYIELSDIVRRYIEGRFQIRAPEMTTEEFLSGLKHADILNVAQRQLLTDFLLHCDMVKFARYLPGGEEIVSSYGSAEKFIEETKGASC